MAEDDLPGADEEVAAEIDFAILEGLLPHQEAAQLGASIEDDLANAGPLSAYMVEVRSKAVIAFRKFAALDLDDKVGIRDCQDAVRHFLDVMDFMRRALTNAEHSAERIAETLSPTDQPRDD